MQSCLLTSLFSRVACRSDANADACSAGVAPSAPSTAMTSSSKASPLCLELGSCSTKLSTLCLLTRTEEAACGRCDLELWSSR